MLLICLVTVHDSKLPLPQSKAACSYSGSSQNLVHLLHIPAQAVSLSIKQMSIVTYSYAQEDIPLLLILLKVLDKSI